MGRERITISVQDSLIKHIDQLIDKQNIRNRSHAIETLLTQAMPLRVINTGVIFIGGSEADKAVAHLEPLLSMWRAHDIQEIYFVLGAYASETEQRFGSGQAEQLTIYYHRTEYGSGGGLKEIESLLPPQFAFANSHQPLTIPWETIERHHHRYKPITTVCESGPAMHGVGISEKSLITHIPDGFSLLEEHVFPALVKTADIILIPNLKIADQ